MATAQKGSNTECKGRQTYVFKVYFRCGSRCGITKTDCKTHVNQVKLTALTQTGCEYSNNDIDTCIDKLKYTVEGVLDLNTLWCSVGAIEVGRRFIYA